MAKVLPNPYRPGAGTNPAFLAGREKVIAEATEILDTIAYGYPARSIVYYGLRGVGKTVLLNHIEDMAMEKDIPVGHIEIPESGYSFEKEIALVIYRLLGQLSSNTDKVKRYITKALGLLKAFTIKYSVANVNISVDIDPLEGLTDTGDISNDIKELLLALGLAAQKANKGVVLLIDEIQVLHREHFEAIMQALHRVNQKGYAVMVFAAGLPKALKMAGDIKSYAERLFTFIEIDSLEKDDAILALVEPAKELGVTYDKAAAERIIEVTDGYPYFLQEYGKFVWKHRNDNDTITLEVVESVHEEFVQYLDAAFFKVRYDRATPKELEFMLAMVDCAPLPCTIKQVATQLGVTVSSISTVRAQLIHKGYIYDTARGMLDFTVPQFDDYLKRIYQSKKTE